MLEGGKDGKERLGSTGLNIANSKNFNLKLGYLTVQTVKLGVLDFIFVTETIKA